MDFNDDTALQAGEAPGSFDAELTDRWWIVTGPNGGLLAALLLRAVQAVVGESRPELAARILTVQFLSGPKVGPVHVQVRLDKDGRRVCFASAVMTQGDRVICQAKVTLVAPLGNEFDLVDHVMPPAPPPDECPIMPAAVTYGNARQRWQRRDVDLGRPDAVCGWLRLDPPVPIDVAVLALMCDNLPPSLRGHFAEPDPDLAERTHTTSIEMTIYFRCAEVALAPTDECLVLLQSATVSDGLHQEEGEVWSANGRLLATSRQLALVFRRPDSH
ncbi:MAG: thioesterase family protein [Acidimicrobiales bacterium]